jgi:acyl-CoA thioesterase II
MANDDGEGIEALLRQIAPRDDGPDAFTFASTTRGHRQFGGITIAQAFIAAAQTVEQVRPHALHILFLRPHMPDSPVRYAVERLRDGRRFTTRRVQSWQNGRLLSDAVVGFVAAGAGPSYQAAAPAVPPPEDLPLFEPWRQPAQGRAADDAEGPGASFLFEQRLIRWQAGGEGRGAALDLWARAVGDVPDDLMTRAAVIGTLSDLMSHFVGLDPNGSPRGGASLDHKLWWHHIPALDDWLLFCRVSDVAVDGRVLQNGAIYTRDGLRCATLAQESLQEDGPLHS